MEDRRALLVVVEDHVLQRRRTVELIEQDPRLQLLSAHETLDDFFATQRQPDADRPDLVLLDLMVDRGPSVDPQAVARMVDEGILVLVFSAMASAPLLRAVLHTGVAGVVGKRDSEEDLLVAIHTALRHATWMSPEAAEIIAGDRARPRFSGQEERALILYASGLTLDAVAAELGVARETAKTYLERVKAKYAASGRIARTKTELRSEAARDQLID
ncbi:response regulator transcription factor [Flexivirga caeni]|uniref:DNA-binding response regulator n=1 Tax=Flexivirga caeni TaxID=2294115 RepID=A0A3M9M6D0_9MICO|nr:response regulator transcription factor [Flexivirga caeni]RNI21129.1 DNA-binding response regulator [Flexivirga caeni]